MNQDQFQMKVIEHMASTDSELKNINGWMGTIDTKVTNIQTAGCAVGGENGRRLDKVERLPKSQALGGGALAGGGIAAIIVGIVKGLEAMFSQ